MRGSLSACASAVAVSAGPPGVAASGSCAWASSCWPTAVPQLVLVHEPLLDHGHLQDADDVGQQVVVAEAGRVVVHEEQHHDGEHLHHQLHARHALLLGHLLLVHLGVDDRAGRHQQGEEAHVVAIEGDVEGEVRTYRSC